MKKIYFVLFCLPLFCFSQVNYQYVNKVYVPNIRSFQLFVPPVSFSNPIINLGGKAYFKLRFDDLTEDAKNYYFTVELCNADWTKADMNQSEYIDGFSEQQIYDYKNSFNTYQPFVHYQDSFPRPGFNLKKTGNYLLKIYLDNDPDNVVVTQRFMIFNPTVEIFTQIHQPIDQQINESHQQVDCIVKTTGIGISNPWNDVKLVIMQNFRWDNAVTLKPLFVKNDELDYHYNQENIFPGGKEFRFFDMRSIRYKGFHIFDIKEETAGLTEVYLYADEPRSISKYNYEKDINGKILIDKEQAFDPQLEADYCYVNFYLPMNAPLTGGKLYVFGAISNWDTLSECRMKYNASIKGYETWIKLKQGYYNYDYIYVDDQTKTFDTEVMEGNWWETENDYQVLVYYRAPGGRYDELLGYKPTNSLRP